MESQRRIFLSSRSRHLGANPLFILFLILSLTTSALAAPVPVAGSVAAKDLTDSPNGFTPYKDRKRASLKGLHLGLIVGGVVLLILFAGIGFCVFRMKKEKKIVEENQQLFPMMDHCGQCGKLKGEQTDKGWRWIHKEDCGRCCLKCGAGLDEKIGTYGHAAWCNGVSSTNTW